MRLGSLAVFVRRSREAKIVDDSVEIMEFDQLKILRGGIGIFWLGNFILRSKFVRLSIGDLREFVTLSGHSEKRVTVISGKRV